ncbi:uncharacterized protein LOC118123388 [Hippoglossus stenolepis]|uniref:uncharacterized protein LOC118123388 n=1 Tax=Hippoglossus stenolepis TaxID=195615 RepID=UPI001FAF7078|nr:uncharacterized protein LOC118123388 [Hippoglossus stenolepis]
MPRLKSKRRSESAKRQMAERRTVVLGPQHPAEEPCRGTGRRHAVLKWPISAVTGRSHKLVLPAESPDKKFVLIVGDSHLRAIVDGFVKMPEGCLSFGVMSTPGARASQLRTEVHHAVVPRTPDVVCVLAPSNNLTASKTPCEAGVEFGLYLDAVRSRWPEVFVLDFPPRLTIEEVQQEFFRQEFHRVAARAGVKYYSIAERFPLNHTDLWSRDGVHLSDCEGMGILVQLLWAAAYQELQPPPPKPQVSPRASSPPTSSIVPRLVVKGEVIVPRRPNPFEWTIVGNGSKVDTTSGLEECTIPLNPRRFSSAVLDAMDHVVPSHLSSPSCTDVPQVTKAEASVVEVLKASPSSAVKEDVPDRMAVTPSLAVSAEPELGSAEAAPASALAPAVVDEVPEMGVRKRRKPRSTNGQFDN